MNTLQVPHEANVSPILNATAVGGAGTSIFGAMTDSGMIAMLGVTITVLSFMVNFIFQLRRDRREVALHAIQVASSRKE